MEDPLEANDMMKSATIYRNSEFNYIYVCYHCGSSFTNSLDTLTHVESHFDSKSDVRIDIADANLRYSNDESETVLEPHESKLNETDIKTECNLLMENDISDAANEPGDLKIEYTIVEPKHHHSHEKNTSKGYGALIDVIKMNCEATGKDPLKKPKKIYLKTCDICLSKFTTKKKLIIHMREQHTKQPSPAKRFFFDCEKCERKIEGKFAFYAHQYGHLTDNEKVSGENDDITLQEKLRRYLDDNILCDETAQTYGCRLCNQIVVKQRYGAQRHIMQQHIYLIKDKRPKRFACEYCGRQFALNSNLVVHKRVHTLEKPYTCSICNKSFSHSSYMRYHEKIHTGLAPHQCNMCGRTFRSNNKLNFHIKCHANLTTKCPICDKELKTHRLKLHIRHVHESEHRPFKCEICSQAFKTAKTLRTHAYRHSEKQFECRHHCKEKFTSSSSRRAHERSKHEAQ